jgi:RNA polymerase sigma factor (sigma-70 family)
MSDKTKQPPDNDLVHLYWTEATETPLLTREQEIELAKRIDMGGEDGKIALEHLIKANLRLVFTVANHNRMDPGFIPFLDLLQAGNLGLMSAAKKFDYRRKNRFSTYAYPRIKAAILREIDNQVNRDRESGENMAQYVVSLDAFEDNISGDRNMDWNGAPDWKPSHHKPEIKFVHISVALAVDSLHKLQGIKIYECCKILEHDKDPVFADEIADIKDYAKRWGEVIFVPCDNPGWLQLASPKKWSYQPNVWTEPDAIPAAHTFNRYSWFNLIATYVPWGRSSYNPDDEWLEEPAKTGQEIPIPIKWWDLEARPHFVLPTPLYDTWIPIRKEIDATENGVYCKYNNPPYIGYALPWSGFGVYKTEPEHIHIIVPKQEGWGSRTVWIYGIKLLTLGILPKSFEIKNEIQGDSADAWNKYEYDKEWDEMCK